jgi:hypothetical protein
MVHGFASRFPLNLHRNATPVHTPLRPSKKKKKGVNPKCPHRTFPPSNAHPAPVPPCRCPLHHRWPGHFTSPLLTPPLHHRCPRRFPPPPLHNRCPDRFRPDLPRRQSNPMADIFTCSFAYFSFRKWKPHALGCYWRVLSAMQ